MICTCKTNSYINLFFQKKNHHWHWHWHFHSYSPTPGTPPRALWLIFELVYTTTQSNPFTSAFESRWPRQQQMPALLRKDTGNPRYRHSRRFVQTASPEKRQKRGRRFGKHVWTNASTNWWIISAHVTCLPSSSIWKFFADSCVTRPPKSSW